MQTFMIPAQYLDNQRLGKQRVEARQIIGVLTGHTFAWRNHPAVRMWDGHVDALAVYGAGICQQWIDRGYQDSLYPWFHHYIDPIHAPDAPWWITDTVIEGAVTVSHWANLRRKNPDHYLAAVESAILDGCCSSDMVDLAHPDLPYLWPTPEGAVRISGAESRRITEEQIGLMTERGWMLDQHSGEVTVEEVR